MLHEGAEPGADRLENTPNTEVALAGPLKVGASLPGQAGIYFHSNTWPRAAKTNPSEESADTGGEHSSLGENTHLL